jgi:hypothetical protein
LLKIGWELEVENLFVLCGILNLACLQIFQFVCIGGTPNRMLEFAYFIMKEIGHKLPTGTQLLDISQYSYRYSMYKVGPVLSISVSSPLHNMHTVVFVTLVHASCSVVIDKLLAP